MRPNEVGALGLKRVPSAAAMRRIASEPTLTPVWEPNEGEEESSDNMLWDLAQPGQNAAKLPPRSVSTVAFAKAFDDEKSERDRAHKASRVPPDPHMPAPWVGLLTRLAAFGESSSLSPLSFAELLQAAHASLRHQLALHLCSGLLESAYLLRKPIATGNAWKIIEGVEHTTQRNFSLKIVSTREAPPRSTTTICPMQAYYLISSFVDEVYLHPNYMCMCMKWGMHDIDSSHQLSHIILDALCLLLEVLPAEQRARCSYLRLSAIDVQHVLLRSMALDEFLSKNLFIQ